MAGKKQKGKKAAARKVAPRKTPARRSAPKKQAPAPQQAAEATTPKTPPEYPWNVVVVKGADRLPVTVTDEAHYTRLVGEFGANHVEVQS